MSAPILSATGLSKNFGGLNAVDNVDLSCALDTVHAIIGPNGAGKTTLINLLSGDLAPSSGEITYRDRDITALPAHRVSRLGIGRSYQRTHIFPEFTCWQNCWLAAQSREPSSLRFFRPANAALAVRQRTEQALATAGLDSRADTIAATVSYGEQRQLEIAMLLAMEPDVLLLDEPLAGMGPEESAQVVELIRRITPGHAVVLIEHDMDAVFAVADVLTVMVDGVVLESGVPEMVRQSTGVREAYLGVGAAAADTGCEL